MLPHDDARWNPGGNPQKEYSPPWNWSSQFLKLTAQITEIW